MLLTRGLSFGNSSNIFSNPLRINQSYKLEWDSSSSLENLNS